MSDIEYLAIKEFESKLRQNDGERDGNTGNVAVLTANTGKDMYLAKATVNATVNVFQNLTGFTTVVLKINNVIVDTVKFVFAIDGGSVVPAYQRWEFPYGFKVDASQTIRIEVTVADAQVFVAGSIVCFEEDDGVSPAI